MTIRYKTIIWILPFLSFSLGYIAVGRLFKPKEFETPSIVGKQLIDAVSILSQQNLNIRFLAEKEDADIPHGTILTQSPQPGRKIKANQSIFTVISKKPTQIPCPRVINIHIDVIAQTLAAKKIRNKNYFLPSIYPHNNCIAQFPSPGIMLKKNNIITYISAGNKKPILLPNFKGKNIVEVVEFLNKYNGIKPEIIHTPSHDLIHYYDETCSVIDQRPLAGSIISIDSKKPILLHLKASSKQNNTI